MMNSEEQFLLETVTATNAANGSVPSKDDKGGQSGVQKKQTEDTDKQDILCARLRRCKWRNIVVVVCLWLAYTLCSAAYSIINPFFPQEADCKGASPAATGAIIATSPMCVVLLSPFLGYILPYVAVWLQVLLGLLLVGCSYVSLAFVVLLPSGWVFILTCMLLRTVEGMGTALVSIAVFSTFPTLFPEAVATLVGLFELGAGFGYALGPSIGGVLYTYGGYRLPFISIGGSLLLFVIPCTVRLPLKTIFNLATDIMFTVLLIVVALSYSPSSYLASALPVFLEQEFDQTPLQISFFCASNSVLYLLLALCVGPLVDKVGHNKGVTVFGLLTVTTGFLLLGLPYLFGVRQMRIVWLSNLILACCAINVVPIYPELLKVGKKYVAADSSNGALSTFASGLITSVCSLAFIIGPLGGGIVLTFLSIPEFAVILAEVMCAQAALVAGLSIIYLCTDNHV